ncbi:MAG: AMP-binding protein [Chitinispirillaceae bacterium]|nr:AMP-binding protein [Chitinispirillaceae bacterium]
MNANIAAILQYQADILGPKTAIVHGTRSVTFSILAKRAAEIGQVFREHGIQPGDRVLFFVPMTIALYEFLLGCWHCGAVAVFMDAWAGKERLAHAAELADCRGFVGVPVAHFFRVFSRPIRRIPVSFWAGRSAVRPRKAPSTAVATTGPDDTALLTFTTGSTGTPKAANRTHGYLRAQHKVLNDHFSPSPDDIGLVTLPIFVLTNLASGITSIIPRFNPAHPERIVPKRLLDDIDRCGVTTASGSPIIFERLADHCLLTGRKAPTLRRLFVGGAPVFPRAVEKFVTAFPNATTEIVYGSTEAEPISAITAPALLERSAAPQRLGLPAGTPVSAATVRVLRITDGPIEAPDMAALDALTLSAGTVGEICVSGQHVLREYYRNDKAQRRNKIIIGTTVWHRTGDAGYLDESGSLYLMGRVKNRFELDGSEHYVFPIEERLCGLPGVRMATVQVMDDNLTLFVESRRGSTGPTDAQLAAVLQDLHLPTDAHVVRGALSRDPRHNSKIDYDRLRARFIAVQQIQKR